MNIKSLIAVSAIALASVGAQAVTTPINLIDNGSFEENALRNGQWKIFYNDSLNDWTAGQYGIELRRNVAGVAQDGLNFVELDTTKNSSMSQSVNISTAGSYLLSFWYNSRPDNGKRPSDTNTLGWSFAGETGTVMENYKGDKKGWEQFSQTFDLKSGNQTLMFSALGKPDSYGTSLDSVSLMLMAPVPEPETYAMMLAGLGLMATIARRRSKAAV